MGVGHNGENMDWKRLWKVIPFIEGQNFDWVNKVNVWLDWKITFWLIMIFS